MNIRENVPLAPLTTFQVGGPARYLAEVKTEDEARQALDFARKNNLPIFVMGGGSNVLVSDEGFPGLVILNRIGGVKIEQSANKTKVSVGAGEDWDSFVARTVAENLSGLEALSGIPGLVGAAPVQNIGAYGREAGEVIASVSVLDMESGEKKEYGREECAFGYRDSFFKSASPGKYLITAVVFELMPGGAPRVSDYPDVEKYFKGNSQPTLMEVRQAIIEIRARKGMVLLPGYEAYKSAGSFFKNPVVSRTEFEKAKNAVEAESGGPGCAGNWFWPQADGRYKLSAACLIERSGFPKGFSRGPVGISPKQPLAVINLGGAKAGDILSLAKDIQASVAAKFGVRLEPEARPVGFGTGVL